MDWIERIFGISPDGGDGTTELLFLAGAVAIVALVIARTPAIREYARRSWQGRH
jgi:hypothetical protein